MTMPLSQLTWMVITSASFRAIAHAGPLNFE
jgi:hypothetical protein